MSYTKNREYFDVDKNYRRIFKNSKIFEDYIIITFLAQFTLIQMSHDDIYLREGGLSKDDTLNCCVEYGYVQAIKNGNYNNLLKYFNMINISIQKIFDNIKLEPLDTCVAYISLMNENDFGYKISKFIKILSYAHENIDKKNLYILCIGNGYNIIKKNFIEKYHDKDIIIKPFKENDVCIKIYYDKKCIYICHGPSVKFDLHGFNFSFLLNHTNNFCLMSGDQSYMEALTLNKKVIHIGMKNKYPMISDIEIEIQNTMKINYQQFIITENIDKTINIDDKNKLLKKYVSIMDRPNYLEIQTKITSKNFFDSLNKKIDNAIYKKNKQKIYNLIKITS